MTVQPVKINDVIVIYNNIINVYVDNVVVLLMLSISFFMPVQDSLNPPLLKSF